MEFPQYFKYCETMNSTEATTGFGPPGGLHIRNFDWTETEVS